MSEDTAITNDLNEAQRLALNAALSEISKEMETISDCRETIKEIIDSASKTFKVEKPLLRKVARVYHNKNIAKYENEISEMKSLYKQVVKI
jgi:F0F1-type ATP synthase membrane subunit b/b'